MKTVMLAILSGQRRPRVIQPERHVWAKAWARRWWLLETQSVIAAREAIGLIDLGHVADLTGWIHNDDGEPLARIIDCGRHGPGGPTRVPELPRGVGPRPGGKGQSATREGAPGCSSSDGEADPPRATERMSPSAALRRPNRPAGLEQGPAWR